MVSVLGFCVNMIGLFFFHDQYGAPLPAPLPSASASLFPDFRRARSHGHSHGDHGHSHGGGGHGHAHGAQTPSKAASKADHHGHSHSGGRCPEERSEHAAPSRRAPRGLLTRRFGQGPEEDSRCASRQPGASQGRSRECSRAAVRRVERGMAGHVRGGG
jgi:hypothetical protein